MAVKGCPAPSSGQVAVEVCLTPLPIGPHNHGLEQKTVSVDDPNPNSVLATSPVHWSNASWERPARRARSRLRFASARQSLGVPGTVT